MTRDSVKLILCAFFTYRVNKPTEFDFPGRRQIMTTRQLLLYNVRYLDLHIYKGNTYYVRAHLHKFISMKYLRQRLIPESSRDFGGRSRLNATLSSSSSFIPVRNNITKQSVSHKAPPLNWINEVYHHTLIYEYLPIHFVLASYHSLNWRWI